MNTGNNSRIITVPNSGIFQADNVFFGAGAYHGDPARFGFR
jgi:hypothetical protein